MRSATSPVSVKIIARAPFDHRSREYCSGEKPPLYICSWAPAASGVLATNAVHRAMTNQMWRDGTPRQGSQSKSDQDRNITPAGTMMIGSRDRYALLKP